MEIVINLQDPQHRLYNHWLDLLPFQQHHRDLLKTVGKKHFLS